MVKFESSKDYNKKRKIDKVDNKELERALTMFEDMDENEKEE